MRHFILSSIVLLFILSCNRQEEEVYMFSYFKDNGQDGLHLAYSTDGLKWEALNNDQSFLQPQLGNERLMRDPCIIQGKDGNYHMVWTVGWNEKGIGYAYSSDLINWSEQQYIPVMEHEEQARNCWAPEVTYDETTQLYYIYWATTITGQFPETDSTAESNYNHRMYYVTTPDFQSFSETKLFYDAGFNVIDCTIKKSSDAYLMFLKNETLKPEPEKNIWLVTAESITGPWSKPTQTITGDYWAEGPTAIQIDGTWTVFFDKYRNHNMGAVQSEDLENWEDISSQVSFPEGTRHGTVFMVPQKVLDDLSTGTKLIK